FRRTLQVLEARRHVLCKLRFDVNEDSDELHAVEVRSQNAPCNLCLASLAMNGKLVEIVRFEWLEPIHLYGNFAWHQGFSDHHFCGPGAAATIPFCRGTRATCRTAVSLLHRCGSGVVIGPCIPGVKIIDQGEHLFLRNVDRNRPLHAEKVWFCSGEDEESYNYEQDRERYFEKHFSRTLLSRRILESRNLAAVKFGNSTVLPVDLQSLRNRS